MIGIIAAMEKEMDAITSLLTNKEEYKDILVLQW